MNRLLTDEIKGHKGKTVLLQGWLHKKRLLGGLNFILLRDRRGVVQILLKEESEIDKLKGLHVGTVLSVKGKVHLDKRAPGGAEIHDPEIDVIVPIHHEPPIEIDKPISHKPEHLDTLFENRVYNLRNLDEQKIFQIRSNVNRILREYLVSREFVEIQTPKLLAEATEGGAEVFTLDYFDTEATLAQSPQLYKQMLVGAYERVFEIGPAFRAEPSATTRHMSEVSMLDIEMGFIKDHQEVMDLVADMTYQTLKRIYQEHSDELKQLKAPPLKIKQRIPAYSMAEIHRLYSKHNRSDTTKEEDLTPDEERWICEYAREKEGCELVYATDLPAGKMKFYHMANDNGTAKSADLLLRGVEIATVPMREHRHNILIKQMKAAGLNIKHPGYKYYLQAFEAGLPPHGGCGFGIDRFVSKIIGLDNVKEATLFPRDINRLSP